MSTPVCIGIIGCGNISDAYFEGAKRSRLLHVKACADLRAQAAHEKAARHGVQAMTVDALLADPQIEIVVNLTVPLAHAGVAMQVLQAGKHVYLEKPLAARAAEARALLDEAARCGLRIGCAPDTFFGASHQACRAAIDAGRIGTPVGGSVAVLSHGMEAWHPNPTFFYQRGGGPILDLGPYYVTQLVNLLGPVHSVTAVATIGNPQRTIASQPLAGQRFDVEVPTLVNGVLRFASGANVALSASWDVWRHERPGFEIYGTEGSLAGTDPNFFGGVPRISLRDGPWEPLPIDAHPFGAPNHTTNSGQRVANYRPIGLVDMAIALREGRPHRASGQLAMHVLEVLEAFEQSSIDGRHVRIGQAVERPRAVPPGADESALVAQA
jgi:predicted dehydrogenase